MTLAERVAKVREEARKAECAGNPSLPQEMAVRWDQKPEPGDPWRQSPWKDWDQWTKWDNWSNKV